MIGAIMLVTDNKATFRCVVVAFPFKREPLSNCGQR